MSTQIRNIIEKIKKMYILDQRSWYSGKDNSLLIMKQTKEIKEIIANHGCITISKFGEESSHKAWLLISIAIMT